MKNQFFASDKLKYIQENQSPQLTGNVNVEEFDFKTRYYAIGSVSLSKIHDESFGNRIIVVEFEPNYSSKTNLNNNMVSAEKALYPDMKSYLDICGSDNVVELSSQLGIRFDGEHISEYIAFERMTVIAHDGKDDTVTEHYHGKILSEPCMHEVVYKYIID